MPIRDVDLDAGAWLDPGADAHAGEEVAGAGDEAWTFLSISRRVNGAEGLFVCEFVSVSASECALERLVALILALMLVLPSTLPLALPIPPSISRWFPLPLLSIILSRQGCIFSLQGCTLSLPDKLSPEYLSSVSLSTEDAPVVFVSVFVRADGSVFVFIFVFAFVFVFRLTTAA